MRIKEACEILSDAGIGVCANHAAFSSSRRGIHGAPTYKVYMPGATTPQIMKLGQVRELAINFLSSQQL